MITPKCKTLDIPMNNESSVNITALRMHEIYSRIYLKSGNDKLPAIIADASGSREMSQSK